MLLILALIGDRMRGLFFDVELPPARLGNIISYVAQHYFRRLDAGAFVDRMN
jgi:hypothetical protein